MPLRRAVVALQHLALGARAPGADALPDGGADGARASRPTSSSARTRIRRSRSARWWCRPSGPARRPQQMAEQVTDKIEKTLQEVPYADILRSYTKPGESLTILQLKDSSPPKEVANVWYQARKKVGDMRAHAAARAWSGRCSTTTSATSTARSTRCRPTASPTRSCASTPTACAQRLLRVPDVAKVEIFGAQPEKLFVEISQQAPGAARARLEPGARAARRAERGRGRRRARTPAARTCRCASAAQFNSVEELKRLPIRARQHRPPVRPARCGSATSPKSGAATIDPPRSRCATRASR